MHTNKNYPQPQPQHPAAIQKHTWALTGFFFFFQFNSTLFTKHQNQNNSSLQSLHHHLCCSLRVIIPSLLQPASWPHFFKIYFTCLSRWAISSEVSHTHTNTHWPSTEGVFGWPLHPCWPLHSGTSCLQRTDTEHVYCRHVDKLSNYGLNKSVMSD